MEACTCMQYVWTRYIIIEYTSILVTACILVSLTIGFAQAVHHNIIISFKLSSDQCLTKIVINKYECWHVIFLIFADEKNSWQSM